MAANAISATIARCWAQRANPAQVTLQAVATAAGYPRNRASTVRGLLRNNGHGAQANGQGRYATNTHLGWHTALTTTHTALGPNATKAQRAAGRSKKVHTAVLGKAASTGARQAKAAGKRRAKGQPAPQPAAPQPPAQPPAAGS